LRHEFHPEILTKVFLDRYGKEEFDDLILKSNQTKHYALFELENILKSYQLITKIQS